MTNKKALPDDITKFFQGESVFFQKAQAENGLAQAAAVTTEKKKGHDAPKLHTTTIAGNHATIPPQPHITTIPSNPKSGLPPHHAIMPPAVVEEIRKTVKQIGKEAATYRLTEAEKQQLADIVYTYKRQGYRTSDNELARIAINWLLWDYQAQGEQSVLARVLEALHR
jgi:hypothetical protein